MVTKFGKMSKRRNRRERDVHFFFSLGQIQNEFIANVFYIYRVDLLDGLSFRYPDTIPIFNLKYLGNFVEVTCMSLLHKMVPFLFI